MFTRKFKNGLLILMVSVFSIAMAHTGGDIHKIAFTMFRFMTSSLILGVLMGLVFKPRSWCGVCPMGHGTVLIKNIQDKKQVKVGLDPVHVERKKAA